MKNFEIVICTDAFGENGAALPMVTDFPPVSSFSFECRPVYKNVTLDSATFVGNHIIMEASFEPCTVDKYLEISKEIGIGTTRPHSVYIRFRNPNTNHLEHAKFLIKSLPVSIYETADGKTVAKIHTVHFEQIGLHTPEDDYLINKYGTSEVE